MNKLLLLLLLFNLPAWGAEPVEIQWVDPEHYTDVRSAHGDQATFLTRTLNTLEQAFQSAAKEYVPQGRHLKLEVVDLDLAGTVRFSDPRQNYSDMRLVTEGEPAYMRFHYQLFDASGKLLDEGDVRLRSRFPGTIQMRTSANKPLELETRMIRHWFKQRFEKTAQ